MAKAISGCIEIMGHRPGGAHHTDRRVVQHPGHAIGEDAHYGYPAVDLQRQRLDLVEVDGERNAGDQDGPDQHGVKGGNGRRHVLGADPHQNAACGETTGRHKGKDYRNYQITTASRLPSRLS